MRLENEQCVIDIAIDEGYIINSTDNKPYDVVLMPDTKSDDFYKTLAINVFSSKSKISIALIGDYYSYDQDCACLSMNILTVLQNHAIIQIDTTSGNLLSFKEIECYGCNFSIHEIANGYIIYGEEEITMLDCKFNKKWSFSGKDIFVSISGKTPFEICGNTICLFDFLDNYYELDFNGQQVNCHTK
ncbi:MAG: hypothetical protein RR235_01430 [Oscillospiraceae bacterium]